MKQFKKIVVFDIETTGTNPFKDANGNVPESGHIIEFGLMEIRKDSQDKFRNETASIDFLVKSPIAPEKVKINRKGDIISIANLTHITSEMLDNYGIKPEELALWAYEYFSSCDNTLLCAYNANFDLNYTKEFIKRYYPDFNYPETCVFFDVMAFYRDYYSYDRSGLGHKLDAAVKNLNVTVQNTHRALDDVKATFEVLKNLMKILSVKFGENYNQRHRRYYNAFSYVEKYPISEREQLDRVSYKPYKYVLIKC